MSDIKKAALVGGQEVSDEELALINKQAIKPMTVEQVYTFKLSACDNVVDRDNERFTERTLEQLAKLYVGKTVLSDHCWFSENQAARVYAAGVEPGENGVKRLILRCYMLRGEHTQRAIDSIDGGILRECSVGCAVEKSICSICGTDKTQKACSHRPGGVYGGQKCHVDLDNATDAYEVSFVAVPAQPGAGVVKAYGGEKNGLDPEANKALLLRLRLNKARAKTMELHKI